MEQKEPFRRKGDICLKLANLGSKAPSKPAWLGARVCSTGPCGLWHSGTGDKTGGGLLLHPGTELLPASSLLEYGQGTSPSAAAPGGCRAWDVLALCLSHVTKIPLFFSRVPSSSWLGCELAWLLQRSHVHEVLWVCAAGTDEAKGFFFGFLLFFSPPALHPGCFSAGVLVMCLY